MERRSPEKRVDRGNGKAYSYVEIAAWYAGKYSRAEIDDYWASLKPSAAGGDVGCPPWGPSGPWRACASSIGAPGQLTAPDMPRASAVQGLQRSLLLLSDANWAQCGWEHARGDAGFAGSPTPVATANASRAEEAPSGSARARPDLVKAVFCELDGDGDGVLSCDEMYVFAKLSGFKGGPCDWRKAYDILCKDNSCPVSGVSQAVLAKLVHDRSDHGCFCTDEELKAMAKELLRQKAQFEEVQAAMSAARRQLDQLSLDPEVQTFGAGSGAVRARCCCTWSGFPCIRVAYVDEGEARGWRCAQCLDPHAPVCRCPCEACRPDDGYAGDVFGTAAAAERRTLGEERSGGPPGPLQ